MIDSKIVIGVLAKDCAPALYNNISRVERLGSCFSSYDVVVLENDSKDETKRVLRDWQLHNESVHVLFKDGIFSDFREIRNSVKHPGMSLSRIARMVLLRNELMAYIREHFNPEIYMLLDIDIENFSVEGILNALNTAPKDWGGLFANGRHSRFFENRSIPIPFQYDYFAYLPKGKSVDSYFSKKFFSRFFKPYIEYRMNSAIQRNAFWECNSAFGGIGLYKWNLVKDYSYEVSVPSAFEGDNSCICEHIPFNMKLVTNGSKNYIAQDIIVNYGKHKDLNDRSFWFRKFTVPYVFYVYSLQSPIKKLLKKLHFVK